MSASLVSSVGARSQSAQRLADYVELSKPRIALLELVTVAVAAMVASGGAANPWVLVHALFGTALVAAGASAWNQWLERFSDARMQRTAGRPLPAGRLTGGEVLVVGSVSSLIGLAWLAALVNPRTATLGAITWLLYVAVYTPLKRVTSFNTVVGAVAGAMPVLMGWAAVGGRLGLAAATMFVVVFLWQFPHFMAIAWIYRREYAQAGLKMLPVVDPSGARAGAQAVLAALALLPVSLLPAAIGLAGPAYVAWALLLGLAQLGCALTFFLRLSDASARWLLRASLIYLPALLVWLVLAQRV